MTRLGRPVLEPGATWTDVRTLMDRLAYAVGRAHARSGRHSSTDVYQYAATLRVHPVAESAYWRGFRESAAGTVYTSAIVAARTADHDVLTATAA